MVNERPGNDWRDVPDTPAWAIELLDELGEDATTIDVTHRQSEVERTIEILTEHGPDLWDEWAKTDYTPMWMRSALVEYMLATSRWAHVRQIAELELMGEMLEEMIFGTDEDASE